MKDIAFRFYVLSFAGLSAWDFSVGNYPWAIVAFAVFLLVLGDYSRWAAKQ